MLFVRERLANDPLALLQPVPVGKEGELQGLRAINLELALFMAHLTGAVVYTDEPAYWRQLHEQTSACQAVDRGADWLRLAEKLRSLSFPIELNPAINFEARAAGKLKEVRGVFRRIWHAALASRGGF